MIFFVFEKGGRASSQSEYTRDAILLALQSSVQLLPELGVNCEGMKNTLNADPDHADGLKTMRIHYLLMATLPFDLVRPLSESPKS